ncbi:hypothetical protein K456DRAFT_59743 [Colletotrichum gloeosporioides 23]|nr:hypothetical protein K456DRAFT_59743 [Colletotrichum gloeosporioides 23]
MMWSCEYPPHKYSDLVKHGSRTRTATPSNRNCRSSSSPILISAPAAKDELCQRIYGRFGVRQTSRDAFDLVILPAITFSLGFPGLLQLVNEIV